MTVLKVAILLSPILSAGANCPLGFWELQDSCYFFSYDKRSWHIAKEFCESKRNCYLTSVENAFEKSEILGEKF